MLSQYIRRHVLPVLSDKNYFDTVADEKLLESIDTTRAGIEFAKCIDRTNYHPKGSARYLAAHAHFPDAFHGSVADIGDRSGVSKTLVKGSVATLDKNNPDAENFDWDVSPLPFKDEQFDSVLCLDTLEHISDIHHAFDDLLRISKKHVVISLPNNWKKTTKEVISGRGIRASYGLPVIKPMDRHRWYMNTEDIENFFYYNAKKNGFSVSGVVFWAPRTVAWHALLPLLTTLIPERYIKNFLIQTVFVHLERMRN